MKRSVMACAVALTMAVAGVSTNAVARYSPPLGQFTSQTDIGQNRFPGAARYDAATGVYRVTGSGADIWAKHDDFHFVSRVAKDDFTIAATLKWVSEGGDPHRKAGLMIRQDLSPDSPYADIVVHGNGHIALQYRETRGGDTHEIEARLPGPGRFALERQGDYVFMSVAGPDGVLHHAGGGYPVRLKGPYLAGLAVRAHSDTETKTVDFSDVVIGAPAPLPPVTASSKVESTLETIDIASTYRAVVYHTADHIEAPNWTPDGKAFLFNSGGRLFSLPVGGGSPSPLNTGALHRLNNDHGLSKDGQWLAVSDQSEPDNTSRVYVLPAAGGEPRRITEQGPSYWHGWSPDGKTLTVIANRGGDFDVYAIPAAGGPETRLTTAPGLDDGADYSPDGQWVYFNSVRSGNMKIWRMHPDGSGQEQVTFGEDTRDWFPHPSPDGKWIAFVSFGTDVAIGDHPANKDVMIRLMPAAGGEPIVLTRVFGGQGTMNVPSWSPDSTHIAFVSYRPVR
ncbi:MAG: TolB family protein [Asticcacaulis sp.]